MMAPLSLLGLGAALGLGHLLFRSPGIASAPKQLDARAEPLLAWVKGTGTLGAIRASWRDAIPSSPSLAQLICPC